jgi:hypothetical protein
MRAATPGDCNPRVLATAAGRQQHAIIAKLVGSLRDLSEIAEVDLTRTMGRGQIATITMGRQKP